jgi:hypothetical protein
MRELQVPTRRVGVRVFTARSRALDGALFLHESRFHDGTAHEVLAELNDPRTFLPFHADDPSMGRVLLHKDHLVRVEMEGGPDPEESPFDESAGAPCTMVLDDGSEIEGRILVPVPAEASRLLDRLNEARRFLPFFGPQGLSFVHRDHVVRVY